MGVRGLWRLLLPIGRRISIETLGGRILAIDSSIWIAQFLNIQRRRHDNDNDDDDDNLLFSQGSSASSPSSRQPPHIVGFLRRICKLLHHGIRPVFVFDGPTPEIKLRELQARRRRRNRGAALGWTGSLSWDGTGGGDEDDDGAAIKRLARRLLMRELQRQKEQQRTKKNQTNAPTTTTAIKDGDASVARKKTSSGAVSEGFGLVEGGDEMSENVKPKNDKTKEQAPKPSIEYISSDDDDDVGVAVAASLETAGKPPPSQGTINLAEDDSGSADEENGFFPSKRSQDNKSKERSSYDDPSDDESIFDIEAIQSLPPSERRDAVVQAQRQRRLQSRKEYLPVAANPAQYSQIQLKNFLASSSLNKQICTLAQCTNSGSSNYEHGDNNSNKIGTLLEGQRSKKRKRPDANDKYISSDDDHHDDPDDDLVIRNLNKRNQLRQERRRQRSKSDDSDDDCFQDQSNEAKASVPLGGVILDNDDEEEAKEQPTNSKRYMSRSWAVQDDDDDDDGGFVTNDVNNSLQENDTIDVNNSENNGIEEEGGFFLDSSNRGSGDEGGFLPTPTDSTQGQALLSINHKSESEPWFASTEAASSSKARNYDDPENDKEEGGFFSPTDQDGMKQATLKNKEQAANAVNSIEPEIVTINDDDDHDEPKSQQKSRDCPSITEDEQLARALQQSEYEDHENPTISVGTAHEHDQGVTSSEFSKDLEQNEHDAKFPHRYDCDDGNVTRNEFSNHGQKASFGEVTPSEGAPEKHSNENDSSDSDNDDDVDWEDGDDGCDDSANVTFPQPTEPATTTSDKVVTEFRDNKEECNPNEDLVNQQAFREVDEADLFPASMFVPASSKDSFPTKETTNNGNNDAAEKILQKQLIIHVDSESEEEKESSENVLSTSVFHNKKADDGGDFDKPLGHDAATAAVFERAQATASNLADWAGRVVRRVIAEHVEESGSPTKQQREESGKILSSLKTDEIAEEEGGSPQRDEAILMTDTSMQQQSQNGQESSIEQKRLYRTPQAQNESTQVQGNGNNGMGLSQSNFESSMDAIREQDEMLHEELKTHQKDVDGVTDEMKDDIVRLLQLFGIPYVEAPAEAEAQCAALEELGLVHGIVTDDSDVFVFGGRNIYKNIFDDRKYVEAYLARDAKAELGLERNDMVALAMLLGGDYTDGVRGVGIVNGMEVLHAFPMRKDIKYGLKRFREWLDGFDPSDASKANNHDENSGLGSEWIFHLKHKSARMRWVAPREFPAPNVLNAYLKPVVDKSDARFSWGTPDVKGLQAFCYEKVGWDPDETARIIEPITKRVEDGYHQTRIESYFMKYDDEIKFANVRSKRLREVFGSAQDQKSKKASSQPKRASKIQKEPKKSGSASEATINAAKAATDESNGNAKSITGNKTNPSRKMKTIGKSKRRCLNRS